MKNPWFIYGTAWKKEKTAALVLSAIKAGFRAIDTANQLKHYDEALVGEGIKQSKIAREDLFLQTKFTPVDGQDERLPYDPNANLTTQVKQSFESSLKHLHTDYLDSYLLHGPYSFPMLGDEDWEVWRAMEEICLSGRAKSIGISNVNVFQLQELWEGAKVKPSFVQNRCFAARGWDRDARKLCAHLGITYQGFSLLTANPDVVESEEVEYVAKRHHVSAPEVVFRFCTQLGILPLTGTSNPERMEKDLKVREFELTPEEVETILRRHS